MGKMLLGTGNVTILANTDEEWDSLLGAVETPFIRTLDEWDEFVSSERVKNGVLASLDHADLMIFRNHLQFDEATRNGKPYRRGCSGWYHGDLVEQHKFTDSQLEEVAALFGVGGERFRAQRDKFGDICSGNVCCRTRLNFNCPDGKPGCGC